ncbi:MAG: PAS domain S-box protein [Chthoniobacterales bacterium]
MTHHPLSLDEASFRRRLRRATLGLSLALGVPLLVLLGLIFLLLRAADGVDHSGEVIARGNALESKLLALQTNFRGYRVSADEGYLAVFEEERSDLEVVYDSLGKLVADNPAQGEQLRRAREESEVWLKFVADEVARVRGRPELISDPEFLLRGAPFFQKTQARLERFLEEERRLRVGRDRSLRRTVVILLSALGLAAIVGAPLLVWWLQALLRRVSAAYQESLTAAETRARELGVTLSSIGDAVVATDAQGRVNFLNPAAEKLMGWTTAEATGRTLAEVFPIFNEKTRAPAANPVERVLRENRVVGLANHTILRTKDGREVPIEDSAAPIRGETGEIAGVILVFRDVTEKRAAETALKTNEARLRFLNQLGDATRELIKPFEIMETTTRLLGEHLGVSRCAYAEVAADGEHFSILHDYTDGCVSTAGEYELSRFGALPSQQMRGGETLVLRDVDVELPPDAGRAMFNAIAVKAIICCPLVKGNALRAMMAVHQTAPRGWSAAEISLVQDVGERSWATIERARAEEEAWLRAHLSALRADISEQLDFGEQLEETLQACCDLLVRHLEVASAHVWLLNEEETQLKLLAGAGLKLATAKTQSSVSLGEGIIGKIATNRLPYRTNDLTRDPEMNPGFAADGLISFAGYPLLVQGRILGVLALLARRPFSDATLADLGAVADVVALHAERKRAESALQTSENLKSAILDTLLDGFILMDHVGRILDWNFASEAIFGFKRAEVEGRLLGEMIVPEEFREAHRAGLERYVATREARILGKRLELPALRKDGGKFPCELSITHVPGTEPPVFAGYARDISAQKENEAALQAAKRNAEGAAYAVAESAERFRLLSEVVALQVWTAQPDGALDFANAECLEYFGVADSEAVLGHGWAQFVHPEDLPRATESWAKALRTGERYEVEFRLRGAGGNYRWFLVRAEALRDEAERIVKWFGTNTDVDDLKVAQREAERASRAKDNFLAVLSHELRTPLTPVLMTASALHQDERLPADVRAQLGMMERNIGLEARLIDDLLDLTRITRGKLPLRPQLCDAHSLIGLAVEIVRDEAQTKGIAVEQELQATNSGLMADPSRFQQVVWNLLRNAVKFTPHGGGSVSIRTRDLPRDEGSWLAIEVTDTGIGIPPEAIERIFRPFEQADLTGDHRFGGVGLGLSIARAIVDLHGGSIRAESSGTGQGSRFVVELPGAMRAPVGVAEVREDALNFLPGSGVAEKPSGPARSLRLLVVEDHEATLQVLTRLLRRAGHDVVPANTVASALAAAASEAKFDLVISDLGLPDGTGNGLMEQLRARYQLRGIALTGYGMEEDLERSRLCGFVSHLIKPVDFSQLRRALAPFEAETESADQPG